MINRLSFFSLLILAACSEEVAAPEPPPNLEGSNWQLVRITVAGGFEFLPDDPGKYVLNFRSDNRLTGTSDCNRLTGVWHQGASNLSFDPFSAGRSLCPPGSLHNTLALNLRDVSAYKVEGTDLVLTTTVEGVSLEFESRD